MMSPLLLGLLGAVVGALLVRLVATELTRMPFAMSALVDEEVQKVLQSPPDKGDFLADHNRLLLAITAVIIIAAEWHRGKFCQALINKLAGKIRPRKTKSTKDATEMPFIVELRAYMGYARLILMGMVRHCVVHFCVSVLRDPDCIRFVTRERWTRGQLDFYLQHAYKLYVDIFARPIASAPDACVDVVKRVRTGGWLFSPIRDFQLLDEVQRCVNLASYNYLGFGCVDEFCTPYTWSIFLEHGFSAAGARTEGGTLPLHRELEREVADFIGKEDAMVIGMGFATNSTVLPALFEAKSGGSGNLVLTDALNHRSIVEGVRLSCCTVRSFKHNCMESLEAELKRAVNKGQPNGSPWRKVFIVVEGIYSMEGDFCPLRAIVTLKNRYKAYLYLDEAHSIGAVGATGRGVTELLGVPTDEIDVMMGTFSKSFGSAGGYVAGSRAVVDALRQSAPGSIFAPAMAPPCAAQSLAALRVIKGDVGNGVGQQKLSSIRENANFFRRRLEEEGFKTLGDVDSPIIPVMFHHATSCSLFSRYCLDRGIAVVSVGSPAVPILYERVRFCISAAHTREQLVGALKEVTELGSMLGVLYEKDAEPAVLAARAASKVMHAKWLRNAPLERRAEAKVATTWSPEPLVPEVDSHRGLRAAALKASTAPPESGTALDLRRFDPVGYVARPLAGAQAAARATMDKFGFGACGPRGFYGTALPHLELEAAIAHFLRLEASILYSAGVATSSSVLPALVSPGDHVIIDSDVHIGLRTGLRLCRAEITWVPHGDIEAFETALSKASASSSSKKAKHRRTFVVVEGICQRTGRVAQLDKLVDLKEKYGALLILDECLSFGAMGAHGRGLSEHYGIDARRVDAIIGSLEHSVAGVGGFCAGRASLIDHQRLAGAGYCFSAASPPMSCSCAVATLEDLSGEGGATRLANLQKNTDLLHETLADIAAGCGLPIELISSPFSYVQHLRWNDEAVDGEAPLLAVAERCAASSGVHIQICMPGICSVEAAFADRIGATPSSPPSLRFCASADHSADSIAAAAAALRAAFKTPHE